jgi:hypothetical protein
MEFYTYVWLRDGGTPYYVGKGKGNRAYDKWGHSFHVPPKERIIIYPANTESEAFENEIALIWYYGRKDLGTGCLRNLTNGGDNPPSQKGKKISAAHLAALVASNKGKTISEEHRKALRISAQGNTRTLGQKRSEEFKKRMSDIRKKTVEENLKNLGRKMSKAQVDKLRDIGRKAHRQNGRFSVQHA